MEETQNDNSFKTELQESAFAELVQLVKQDDNFQAFVESEAENVAHEYRKRCAALTQPKLERASKSAMRQVSRTFMGTVQTYVQDMTPSERGWWKAASVLMVAAIVFWAVMVGNRAQVKVEARTARTERVEAVTAGNPAVEQSEEMPNAGYVEVPNEKPIQRGNGGLPSQEQKDITAGVCRKVAESRKDFLDRQNVSVNLFLDTCYYDMLAIAWTESRFDCSVVGKVGEVGCFQIRTAMHKVSADDARDYRFASEWTLDRMVRDGSIPYPHYRTAQIRKHNGAGAMAVRYADTVIAKSSEFRKIGL